MMENLAKASEVMIDWAKEISSNFNPDNEIKKGEPLVSNSEYNPDDEVGNKSANDVENKIVAFHDKTGVPYVEKLVKSPDTGEFYPQRFPVFDSQFDARLPEQLYKASDRKQFSECNRQLKMAIDDNPSMVKKFTSEQLDQIKNGQTPDGFTWHHNEEDGKVQLVDSYIHAKTGHVGGRKFWGGGNANR